MYNKKINDCITYKSITDNCENRNYNIYIWDNSDDVKIRKSNIFNSDKYSKLIYKSSEKNQRLSKVYNTVVSKISNYDYLVVLDDDTALSYAYFSELFNVVKKKLCPYVIIPKVTFHRELISPGKIHYVKGSKIKKMSYGIVSSRNLTAIMSGTAINRSYLDLLIKNYGYCFDERLSFYSIDTAFFKVYRKIYDEIYVLNVELEHSSALRSNLSIDERLRRYSNLYQSWKIVYSDNTFEKIMVRIFVMYSAIKSSMKFKDLRFLRCI